MDETCPEYMTYSLNNTLCLNKRLNSHRIAYFRNLDRRGSFTTEDIDSMLSVSLGASIIIDLRNESFEDVGYREALEHLTKLARAVKGYGNRILFFIF